MSLDNVFKGVRGEYLASAFLLRHRFQVAKPEPDTTGIDCIAVRKFHGEFVSFLFQFKSDRRFPVNRAKVEGWIDGIERVPVFLVHVEQIDAEHQRILFRTFFEWMTHRWPQKPNNKDEITFSVSQFVSTGSDGTHFETAVTNEADRILGKRGALFRSKQTPTIPLRIADLYTQRGHLGDFEVKNEVLGELAKLKPRIIADGDDMEFLRELWSRQDIHSATIRRTPAFRRWIDVLSKRPSDAAIEQDTLELRRFFIAMERFRSGKDFRMPRFVWSETSRWRILCAKFPESFHLLDSVLTRAIRTGDHDRLRAGLHLASGLVHVGDNALASSCCNLIGRVAKSEMSSIVTTHDEYVTSRMIRFARAQAEGDKRSVNECLDFMHKHNTTGEESLLHRAFYQGGDADTVNALSRILNSGKRRDVPTKPIVEYLLEDLS